MKPARGRTVALATAALGTAVLAGTAIASREWIAETWWIYRLDSSDPEKQLQAVQKLGEMRSRRAIPALVKLSASQNVRRALIRIGPEAISAFLKSDPDTYIDFDEDPDVLPVLVACLDHPDAVVRRSAIRSMEAFDDSDLRTVLEDMKNCLEKEKTLSGRLVPGQPFRRSS